MLAHLCMYLMLCNVFTAILKHIILAIVDVLVIHKNVVFDIAVSSQAL